MKSILTWKKGIFKNTFEIYSSDSLIGTLKENSWKQTATGELNGTKISFRTKGFFTPETEISDSERNNPIGKITYNTWKTKATIEYNNKSAEWKYDNFLNTKWSLSNSEGVMLQYNGSFSKGEIEVFKQDEILLLAGLFITNYFWQISSMVILAVLLPLWITAS
jgi:hypothetical protein